jgi:hypothetical protein
VTNASGFSLRCNACKATAALQRKDKADRVMTKELRRFRAHYERFALA